ncbi:Uncharacterized protein PPKH_2592 [Pseudomonas putida]|nr:Uncharacterized protein PPKH_2592 [Pseudomonas putida]
MHSAQTHYSFTQRVIQQLACKAIYQPDCTKFERLIANQQG